LDRNTITGLVLIFLIFVGWIYFTMPSKKELQQRKARRDSIAAVKKDSIMAAKQDSIQAAKADSAALAAQNAKAAKQDTAAVSGTKAGKKSPGKTLQNRGMFSRASLKDTSTVVVQTPLYRTTFTNVGAGPAAFTLRKYKTWNGHPVQLIRDTTHSAYNVGFMSSQNHNVDLDHLLFKQLTSGDSLRLKKGETKQLKYALNISAGRSIIYTYTFHGDSSNWPQHYI
jgi:YidC/Oxa1 family membrane protein insertase